MGQSKKATKNYCDLPDTITPADYSDWRGIGIVNSREIFKSTGFPAIKGAGGKQLADKRAVLLFELGLKEKDKQKLLKEIARELITNDIEKGTKNNEN